MQELELINKDVNSSDEEKKGKFVDSEMVSRFGAFNIRIYKDEFHRETVVLWSRDVPLKEPVLIRVHSECVTGDIFGSLHCDCGQQLIKSLRLISREGGVLIYLRQEGRGIGLFEKIKTYKLQAQGHDTFEANLLLGHFPDTRSYEMVKVALQDLGIEHIKLLTNNPSKVSDISSLGIAVVDIMNLPVKPCKYNRKYLNTKKIKFSHFSSKGEAKYQYQFYASDTNCIHEIGVFLSEKRLDPLLRICAAISLNHEGLNDLERCNEIKVSIDACRKYSIEPVLHFSCVKSIDVLTDLAEIKNKFPEIHKIQLNDWDLNLLPSLEEALKLYRLDIPVSQENMCSVRNKKIRNLLKKYQCLVILDDSKGRGQAQKIEVLRSQINELLQHGINRIGLAGGFGPDALNAYFWLKRFYRINFSIDSETGVKTAGGTDAAKVKLYLTQLLRNDHPRIEGIEQTKRFLEKHRRSDWESIIINGTTFQIHPTVFHAGKFPSTAWFAEEVIKQAQQSTSFCEVGCGAGVISCCLALANPSVHIIATDLNPAASENTHTNAQQLGISDRISVKQGDVLDSIEDNRQFDIIFWALPFGFLDPGTPITLEEAQVFDPGYRAIRKLLKTARKYLKQGGKLLLGFSADLGHEELLQSIAKEVNASSKVIAKTTIQEDVKLQFEILEFSYQ